MANYTTSKVFFISLLYRKKLQKKEKGAGLEKFHISVRKGEKEN
jgi:hypothetical protein